MAYVQANQANSAMVICNSFSRYLLFTFMYFLSLLNATYCFIPLNTPCSFVMVIQSSDTKTYG